MAFSILASPASAADQSAPLPPVTPWHGASERLVVPPADPWITPAEARGFDETPSYAETRAWIDRLVAASPLLRIEAVRTHCRRGASSTPSAHPSPADGPKPVLLAQAGIHSGEIDGKDAGLMLLRDIALRGKDELLDHADLLFVPIFNADGHERSSPYNRPNQRGPRSQGWRTTAQNLNLNRDYLKADTPEMQAMIGLLRKVQPALYLDLHVTDGIDYQYDITFAFPGWRRLLCSLAEHRPLARQPLPPGGRPRRWPAPATFPGMYIDAVDGRNPDKGIDARRRQPAFLDRLWRPRPHPDRPGREPFAEALQAARARHLCADRGIASAGRR